MQKLVLSYYVGTDLQTQVTVCWQAPYPLSHRRGPFNLIVYITMQSDGLYYAVFIHNLSLYFFATVELNTKKEL